MYAYGVMSQANWYHLSWLDALIVWPPTGVQILVFT
jgi:hypothetical protein